MCFTLQDDAVWAAVGGGVVGVVVLVVVAAGQQFSWRIISGPWVAKSACRSTLHSAQAACYCFVRHAKQKKLHLSLRGEKKQLIKWDWWQTAADLSLRIAGARLVLEAMLGWKSAIWLCIQVISIINAHKATELKAKMQTWMWHSCFRFLHYHF